MATFGERLKELRTRENLTQKQVADYLGIATNAYQNYEYNKREMNITTLSNLADYFNVSVDYLIGRSNDSTSFREYKKSFYIIGDD